jgi:hypothetical protein
LRAQERVAQLRQVEAEVEVMRLEIPAHKYVAVCSDVIR